MGTDYYSYIVAGVDASKYISPIEYEEKTPSYVEIESKKENIYFENGKPIFDVYDKQGWVFKSQIYKSWNELEKSLTSLGLTLVTQGCEYEIWEGDAIGLLVSECEHNVTLDMNMIRNKLKKVEEIFKSIGIDEKPQVINILHIDY